MRDLKIINTTFKLRESITVPFSTSSRQEWTARQRLIAAKAQIPCDLDDFSQLVSQTFSLSAFTLIMIAVGVCLQGRKTGKRVCEIASSSKRWVSESMYVFFSFLTSALESASEQMMQKGYFFFC
jgi:hypothetical protein